MGRPRVLFLAGWYPNEDHPLTGIFIQRHARAISPWCDVGVVYVHQSLHRTKKEVAVTVEDGVKTVRIYMPRPPFGNIPLDLAYLKIVNSRFVNAMQGIRFLVREFRGFDIIHLHEIRPLGIVALLAKHWLGIPLITTEHSSEYHDTPPSGLERRKCRRILENSAVVLPVSRALERDLVDIAPGAMFEIVPNVVETSSFVPTSVSRATPKKRLLHVSLLDDAQKNISGILTATARLKQRRDDFELHIVGDGPDRQKLELFAKSLELSDTVVFHGMVSDQQLPSLMNQSHVFVLNSNYETFAIVGVEALASGVPIISTRCGGPEEYVNASNGVLIDVGDTDQLVEAMNLMLDSWHTYDPDVLHDAIVERYSEGKVGKMMLSIYNDVLARSA